MPDRPGVRLRTLADVFAYVQAEGVVLRLDATEVQVRRRDTLPATYLAIDSLVSDRTATT